MKNYSTLISLMIIVLTVFFLGVKYGNSKSNLPDVDTVMVEIDTVITWHAIHNEVWKPARVDTVWVKKKDSTNVEEWVVTDVIAKCDTVFRNQYASDSLAIQYSYETKKFHIKSDLEVKSELINKNTTIYVHIHDKLNYITNLGIYTKQGTYEARIGAGIRLFEKVDIVGSVTTDKQIGLDLGFNIK